MKQQNYPRTTEGFKQLWSEFHNRALEAWDKMIGHSKTKIVLWTSDLTRPETITKSLDKNRYIFNQFFYFNVSIFIFSSCTMKIDFKYL